MEKILNGTVVIEAVLLSFLVALWLTWSALRGLFRLMPVTARPGAKPEIVPVRGVRIQLRGTERREAA